MYAKDVVKISGHARSRTRVVGDRVERARGEGMGVKLFVGLYMSLTRDLERLEFITWCAFFEKEICKKRSGVGCWNARTSYCECFGTHFWFTIRFCFVS